MNLMFQRGHWLITAVVLILLSGCSPRPDTETAQSPATDSKPLTLDQQRHEAGRRIYNFRCYFCHGYSGDAQTLAASFLDPKPRNFTQTDLNELSRQRMLASITAGRTGTAMKAFGNTLTREEIALVADFVRHEFMQQQAPNTRYHTVENGWPDHQRYQAAYPFATGELALDTPWRKLTATQRRGKQLFLNSCISCHDRARVIDQRPTWTLRAVSYPRNQHQPGDHPDPTAVNDRTQLDAMTEASPFLRHDIPPQIPDLTPQEKQGEQVFQQNCAFCHAADGTAKNWIGSFMQPSPRNLTSHEAMHAMTPGKLKAVIRNGLPGTSMPAWKTILTDSEIEAVIAYISRAFYPVSATVSSFD